MEKGMFGVLLVVFLMGAVFAVTEDWSGFVDEDELPLGNSPGENEEIPEDNSSENLDDLPGGGLEVSGSEDVSSRTSEDNSGSSYEYTEEYFLAWAFAGLGVLIVLVLFYFLLRRPKNRWEK